MGRTALYRDPVPLRSARAEIHLDPDMLTLALPEGRARRCLLDGFTATCSDGYTLVRVDLRAERRFVRMLVLERDHERLVIITPPEHGAVAPNVVRVPEAASDAVIVDVHAWETLADWLTGGGRLAGCAIADLARLAEIASATFAVEIGELAAQRALEHTRTTSGPLRGSFDLESALHPLVAAARRTPRVSEAVAAARALAAGVPRPRRRVEPSLGLRRLLLRLFERLLGRPRAADGAAQKLATRVIAR